MGEFKYKAFISYSHADEKWARWLHRALESYKPPKHLIGKQTAMGQVPEKMAPVFRDREELASSTDLGANLTAALEASACQVVICSISAAKSHWVNEEIKAFKRLGRSDRIFSLIVEGEPYATGMEGFEQHECFPQALQFKLGEDGELSEEREEPIAADARPGKDGKNHAKVKLLAGMLGVGFDDLRQRELQRRNRRLAIISGAAVVGMVVAIGLATSAIIARNEAEVQRARAETETETARQTTDFMVSMFSVSDPSEARGNTITAREIMDQGAGRIEQELATQPTIQATLMETMGTVYTSLGLYEQAASLLQSALDKRRELFGERHLEVARTYDSLGEVLTLQAEYMRAGEALRSALTVRRELLGEDHPDVADSLAGLAEVLTQEGEFEQAEPLLREALQIRVTIFGEENLEVAQSTERLGLNLFDQGDLDAAEPYLRRAIEIRKHLARDEPHPDLANGLNDLGILLYNKGELEETETLWREALAMNRKLLDPTHPDIAYNLFNLAMVSHDKGDFEAAEALYSEVLQIRRQALGEEHPDIAFTLNNFAFLLYDKGDHSTAIAMANESIVMYRKFFPDGHPALARTVATLGGWLTREGEFEDAEPLLIESLAMRRKFLGSNHPEVAGGMTRLAYLYLKTGQAEEARDQANAARTMFSELLPPGHWRTVWVTGIEGASLTGMNEFETAEQLLLESYKALPESRSDGSRARYVEEVRGFLVELYQEWGKPELAAKYGA